MATSDNLYLKYAIRIPLGEIRNTHIEAKQELFIEVEQRTGIRLDPQVMTIGFARRATEYKRHDLLFYDLEQLRGIVRKGYPNQFATIMRSAIALNGSYFNAQRMITQYLQNAYLHPANINIMSKQKSFNKLKCSSHMILPIR
ncbi:hypothetical protein ACFLW6_02545 [Chloroflexota bacterium]